MALPPRSFLLLCIILTLFASVIATGTELKGEDAVMQGRLREHLIRQLGSSSSGELYDDAFLAEDLQAHKTKIPGLAAMIHKDAQDGRKIITVPEPSPPSSRRGHRTFKNLLGLRKTSSSTDFIHSFPKPVYYASIIQPDSRVGELIGLRPSTLRVKGRNDGSMDRELTFRGESGTQGLAFWKHEDNQVHLLAIDTWFRKIPPHRLLPLRDVIPIHYLTEIH
ncbi:uncharacterized protein UTRI_10678 [Ustilago trichophora]|uniref:Uncharacterized protein n=1 Tax=Ustilago trichophora TaxID=86804 RepID=A0A5C3E8D9_9BASI|nr:uncharacterized protein UTRI_10678 [Ustilago trichophora]